MVSTVIEILASLGLFLFGMLYLEEQIKSGSGRAFKRMLNSATRTNLRSLSWGIGATALFQSSSLVSLMTLSLIGAGVLTLQNGIGIIFGSNIGTTFTTWIVAIVGFKMNIKILALSIIALGGISAILVGAESRWRHYYGGMVGFGLIFLGLEGMKENFSLLAESFDIALYKNLNPYLFLVIGLILTGIIQASAAAIAIAQTALFTGLISFETAALFAIGANVGTTVTILLGALGGSPDKKRAAAVHILFNISTALIAVILLSPLTQLTFMIIPPSEPVIALAMFHTLFNIFGVLLWFFWIPKLASMLSKRFQKSPLRTTRYIHSVTPKVPLIALESLEQEITHLTQKVSEFALFCINVIPPQALKEHHAIDKLLDLSKKPLDVSYIKLYMQLQELEGEIFEYASAISLHITKKEQKRLNRLTNVATRMASASKAIKDMLGDFEILSESEIGDVQRFYHNIRYQILSSTLIFNDHLSGKSSDLSQMKKSYQKIDNSYKGTLESIASIAQHQNLSKNITTIAINDVHLTRRFTKNLYRALQELDATVKEQVPAAVESGEEPAPLL